MFSTFGKYDEAFKTILKNVFSGDVVYEPVDTAFEYAVKQTENSIKFPMISIYRDNNIILDHANNAIDQFHVGTRYENPMTVYDEETNKEKGVNIRLATNQQFLYIIIGYQINVWGIDRLSTEQVAQELIFWLYRNQQISMRLMKDDLNFTFSIDKQLIDNSDLTSYHSQGKLYRYTLSVELQSVLVETQNYFTLLKPIIEVDSMKE